MRRLAWGLVGAASVCGLVLGGGWIYGRMSLPQLNGTLVVQGPVAPVEIRRDSFGIPTIISANEHDAYFALGFVHAQDRLFQMELMRRMAQGRLAEIFGPKAVSNDRFMRTLGLLSLAKSSLQTLDHKTQAALQAYADGVNAQIANSDQVPPEFTLLGITMEPWKPEHSLLWARLMGLRLSANLWDETLRAELAQTLPPQALTDLWPTPKDGDRTTVPTEAQTSQKTELRTSDTPKGLPLLALLDQWPEVIAPQVASNAWAVGDERSASGKPLLANDPHLGLALPSQWYLAELRLPERTIAGATAPGVPFHLIGYNDRIAWGFTTTHSDTMDLFVETLSAPDHVLGPNGPEPLRLREETISVRGAEPISLEVRSTHHGPVISDLLPGAVSQGQVITLAATALQPDDRSPQAFYQLTHAASTAQALSSLQSFDSPQQNMVVADDQGTLAFAVSGRTPQRGQGDGTLPADGSTGAADWRGWVAPQDLPRWDGGSDGLIISANNRPSAQSEALAQSWPPSYRAQRVADLLDSRTDLTLDDMQRAQGDTLSPLAAPFIAHLSRAASAPNAPLSPPLRKAITRLQSWDGMMDQQRPEPLLFSAWLVELQKAIFAEKMGLAYSKWGGLHPQSLLAVLDRSAAQKPGFDWCAPASCDQHLLAALQQASESLSDEFGSDMSSWRWGEAHRIHLNHPLFTHVPILNLLSDRKIDASGGAETLNRASFPGGAEGPWEQRLADVHGPSLRMVVDLADHHLARTILLGGQSGHPLSPYYDDQVALWKSGQGISIGQSPAVNTLFLEPEQ
jgi:penicillin amidase